MKLIKLKKDKLQYMASVGTVADNNIRRQQKFYSLPKRYKQIRPFGKGPSSGISAGGGGSGKARVFLYK